MAKTSLEKIANYKEQMGQIANRSKQEQQKHKAAERKARTKRLCSRMGLFESILPDTITLTDEQFKTFLEKTVASKFGRRVLAELVVVDSDKSKSAQPKSTPQDNASAHSGEGNCAGDGG